jgi:aldehyde dehydrogenase (NAD+)
MSNTFQKTRDRVLTKCGLEAINSGVYNGEWAPIKDSKMITVASPINGEAIAKVAIADKDDYEKTIQAAESAFAEWSSLPPPRRGEAVRRIGDDLVSHKENLGLLVSLGVGKTISEGQGEVQEMIDISYFATGLSRQLYGLTIASERMEHRMYEQWKPLGIVGVTTAFNFPIAVWSWNSLIAAVIGDVVIWKPSSKAPLTAIAVTKIANRVLESMRLPQIFFLLVGPGLIVGDALNNDPRVPLVSFTGSVATGKRTSEAVARRLGRSILELGGNNCAIVTGDCDLGLALKGVAFGALATAGQRCTSTRRAVVHESVYAEFLSKITKIYREVTVGNPLEAGTLVGPLIDRGAIDSYLSAVSRAEKEGGRIVYGGGEVKVNNCEGGYYVQPTIIEAKPTMDIVREETFAPILYVFKYRTIEEAVVIHNDVPQGLSSSIFTKNLREEEYFLSHKGSDCGIANVNTGTAGAEIGGAFGGEKETGGGRESGSDAWKAYARRQTVTINYGRDVPLAQGVKFDV